MPKDAKAKLFDAALREFSAHGYAGARVNRIARSAQANKQLIYYYFSSKRKLYQQVLTLVYEQIAAAEAAVPPDLEHDLIYWMDFHLSHPHALRLLEWDGLAYRQRRTTARGPGRLWRASIDRIDRNQSHAGWPAAFRSEQMLITSLSLVTWPLLFPQICRQITGMNPDDPRFVAERREFISTLARALRPRRGASG
jgi:AcrR family transcriptional regulator